MATAGLRAARRGLVLSPDDPAPVAARAVLRFHLRSFDRNESGARAGEIEPLHQLRVTTRRLRAALRFFAPVLPARVIAWAQREMTWLAQAIGPVRDLDVLTQAVTALAARLDPELRAALGPLALAIHDRRSAAHVELMTALDSRRCRRLLDRLATFADAASVPAEPKLGRIAAALVRPFERALLRAGRHITADSPAGDFHKVRVRAKRLRYGLETLRGLGDKRLRKLLGRLEDLQDVLGEHQDAVMQIAWLRRFAESADAPPATLLAAGALVYLLARRAGKRRARFRGAWQRVDNRRLLTALVAELAPRGHGPVRAAS